MLFAAVAVYVSSAASWQTVVAPAVKEVGPVDGLTVTVLVFEVVPHNPVAVAVMVAVPLKDAFQFIIPVEEPIVPAVPGETE